MYSSRRKSKRSYRKRVASRKNKTRSKRKNLKFRKMRGGASLNSDQINTILREKEEFELLEYFNGLTGLSEAFAPKYFENVDYVNRANQQTQIDEAIENLRKKQANDTKLNEDAATRAATRAAATASASNPATSSAPSSNQAAPTRASAPAPARSIFYIDSPILSNGNPIEFEQTIPRQGVVLNKVTMLSSMDEGKTYTISEMEHNSKDPYPKINYHVIKEPNVVEEV